MSETKRNPITANEIYPLMAKWLGLPIDNVVNADIHFAVGEAVTATLQVYCTTEDNQLLFNESEVKTEIKQYTIMEKNSHGN